MDEARRRLPHLLKGPAAVHWLSCEPMLEHLDLSRWANRLNWIVVGGESGGGARAMDPAWVPSLRDQCAKAGTAFWMKQSGSNRANWPGATKHGEILEQLPSDLRIRELPLVRTTA
jgi:protein gp37